MWLCQPAAAIDSLDYLRPRPARAFRLQAEKKTTKVTRVTSGARDMRRTLLFTCLGFSVPCGRALGVPPKARSHARGDRSRGAARCRSVDAVSTASEDPKACARRSTEQRGVRSARS